MPSRRRLPVALRIPVPASPVRERKLVIAIVDTALARESARVARIAQTGGRVLFEYGVLFVPASNAARLKL